MSDLNLALQALLEKACRANNAHAVLLNVQSGDNRISFHSAVGAEPNRAFPIASISKMFTATLVRQLMEEGKLNPDQSVQSVLPQIDLTGLHVIRGVDHGPDLLLHHLLLQTSGLADYYQGGVSKDVIKGHDHSFTIDQVVTWAKAIPAMARPDSGKAHYSDTNFQLLGAIVESVTGQPYDVSLQKRICGPLGLKRTAVNPPDGRDYLPLYYKDRLVEVPRLLHSMGPDGGIVSTTDELMIFLRAFLGGHLFQSQTPPLCQTWNPMFFPFHYGCGVMRFKLPGWMTLWQSSPELIGHSGASGSFAFHAPKQDIFLVGTFNQLDGPKAPFRFMLQVLRTIAKEMGQ